MPISTFQIRGRPTSRAGAQYAHLLRARTSLQEAHQLSRKPELRALAATAISRIDAVIDRIEGRSAKPATRSQLELELEVNRLRHRPLHR